MLHTMAKLSLTVWKRAIAGVAPEVSAQAYTDKQAHLAHYLFDFLGRPSQHDRPACRPSPAPAVRGNGSQSCSKGIKGR